RDRDLGEARDRPRASAREACHSASAHGLTVAAAEAVDAGAGLAEGGERRRVDAGRWDESGVRRPDPAADELASQWHQQRTGRAETARELGPLSLQRPERAAVVIRLVVPDEEREV